MIRCFRTKSHSNGVSSSPSGAVRSRSFASAALSDMAPPRGGLVEGGVPVELQERAD